MSITNNGGLLRATLGPRRNDTHQVARARLLHALERMRENVAALITQVPADCKGLTVHDVTHLDALWEMASLLAGDDYDLNPAEAFVLGGAILLHDAGLSAAAFPRGEQELKALTEWSDIAAATLRQNNLTPNAETISNPPAELLPEIKFGVLRAVHAKQAERMATNSWTLPNGEALHLLEDTELRQAFGSAIGRVAHSHHWDIERVADILLDNVGTGTSLPAEWSVSERKVACLLRCADASHIDRRRAPSILFSASKPSGVSAAHWGAQNKINKPTVDGSALIYSAGQPFSAAEAESWWLSYDLVRLVDKEIRSANSLLEELHFAPLKIRRVVGAESPRALSVHIRPDGWRPVDAEVRVSDPVHLARTLGGRNLYGPDPLAPVRELLQNAADAVRARRQLEDRDATWGAINITIEADPDHEASCWLHVDDNGIGMTERVLAGPLIDFGRSIWNSSILREEFPGLESRSIQPIGKFGIGFFSVFEISNHVKVVSKHFAAGALDANVLEFQTLSSRPLVRQADAKELPRDVSTRVSLRVDNKNRVVGAYRPSATPYGYVDYGRDITFQDAILRLVAFLDIDVTFLDRVGGGSFSHSFNVHEKSAHDFLDELLQAVPDRERETIITAHAALLRPISDKNGVYGRAALSMTGHERHSDRAANHGAVSVGGFTYSYGHAIDAPYVGAIEGNTEQAARQSATSNLPAQVIANWATEQASLIDQKRFLKSELMRAAESVIRLGGDPGDLPYCFTREGTTTFAEAKEIISNLSNVHVLLSHDYAEQMSIFGCNELRGIFFDIKLHKGVFVLRIDKDMLISEDISELIIRDGRRDIVKADLDQNTGPLQFFMEAVAKCWNCEPQLSVESIQAFDSETYSEIDEYWALRFRRPKVGTA